MYILIAMMIIIIMIIIVVYFFVNCNWRTEEVIIEDRLPKTLHQEIKVPKPRIILQYSRADEIKYNFYHPSTFTSFMTVAIYKKIIVNQLWVDEPFHSTFVKIIQIIDKSDSWIQSKRTKKLKLKIRKNNSEFERGTSFKVYSLLNLSFDFASNMFEYFRKNPSTERNIKNILLASLLFNINNVNKIKHWCKKELTHDELRLCLVSVILEHYTHKKEVIHILNLILIDDSSIQYILHIYDEAVRRQQEYPYVKKENEELSILDISVTNHPL